MKNESKNGQLKTQRGDKKTALMANREPAGTSIKARGG